MLLRRLAALVFLGISISIIGSVAMTGQNRHPSPEQDRDEILDHIHTIFQAYIQRDRATILQTHTSDWVGFQGPSTGIERGINAYMKNADRSLQRFHGTGYELLDTEVQLYGDVGLVYYVARYDFRNNDGTEGSIPLRSLDVYCRQRDGSWNQCGSHITVIPSQQGSWGEDIDGQAGSSH